MPCKLVKSVKHGKTRSDSNPDIHSVLKSDKSEGVNLPTDDVFSEIAARLPSDSEPALLSLTTAARSILKTLQDLCTSIAEQSTGQKDLITESTTWTQEMVWCISNDLDFVGAKKILPDRFAFLELTSLFDFRSFPPQQPGEIRIGYGDIDSVTFSQQLPSPRFIKSHLPWQMLPKQIQEGSKKTKVVYVARSAKDTCLSLYHHSVSLGTYAGDFDTFARLFLADIMIYSPFWPHVSKYWEHRNDENLLFLKFEDMKKDLPSVIRQTAAFLGKTLTESQVHILAEHLSFSKMKDNPAVNYSAHRRPDQTPFMRKGEVGQWKTDMSPELVVEFDKWSKEHIDATGITF